MFRNRKSVFYLCIIVVSWIIIFAIPSFRDMFLAQSIRGGFASLNGGTLPAVIPHSPPDFSQLSKQHPNSLALKLRAIAVARTREKIGNVDPAFNPRSEDKPVIGPDELNKQIDDLPNQFPQSPLALAYTLNNCSSQMHGIRRAGSLEDMHSVENRKRGIPSPEREGTRDYTGQQWQHVIDLCKRGQKMAPQNAYFDVIDAYWQFEEFHDAAAWAAFSRASKKETFDLYEVDYGQYNVQATQIAYGGSLYWEE